MESRQPLEYGAAYENMGMNQLSLKCYENAIQIFKKQMGISKTMEAQVYNQIGSCPQNMQMYVKAYDAYKNALDILEKYAGNVSELYGAVLNNMGQLMQETKKSALNYYGRALKCYQKYFPGENGHIANIFDNMGSIFDMREEYKKASYFHLKGLWYRFINGGLYTSSAVISLHNLANTWYSSEIFSAYFAEKMAVQGLKKQELPVYLKSKRN